ncbi:MAG: polysaccharide deacetylase family protein, partial [bacterium]|nr:polysaccharide deacetylase family protein [bacterium]
MADPIVDTRIAWPQGAKCAVMLSFDFDAETLWIGRDKINWKRPGVLSQGKYGAYLGVPKILEILEDAGVPATFFVPGWTAENHTVRVEQILERGHEVGHHSYLHEWIDPEDPAAEEAELDRGLEALQSTVGIVPSGYRSPAGETSDN